MAKAVKSRRKPAGKQAGSSAKEASGSGKASGSPLTKVLILLAVVLAGVAIYVASNPADKPAPPSTTDPGTQISQAERILNEVEPVLNQEYPNAALEQQALSSTASLMQSYIRAHPDDVEIRPVLGEVLLRLGRLQDTEVVVTDLLRLDPGSPEGLWLRGDLRRQRGADDWRDWYRKAAQSSRATPRILGRYGLLMMIENRPEQAESYLRRAVQAGVDQPHVLAGLAQIELESRNFRPALELARRASDKQPDDTQLLMLLARAQRRTGDYASAARTLDKAIQRSKQPWPLWMELGEVRTAQGAFLPAAEAFAEAAAYRQIRPLAALKAARAYYFEDRFALAMKYIDMASEYGPQIPQVATLRQKIENARFGPPQTDDPELDTFPWPAPSATTQPVPNPYEGLLEGVADPSDQSGQ